ncbi:MAG: hypothetical protein ACP5XB_08575 [Isosphaeraceae bacterium]
MNLDRAALAILAWNQLWQVTLVALLLGIAARLIGRSRPHLAHTLWMLVLVKALVPPIVSSPTGIFSWTLAAPGILCFTRSDGKGREKRGDTEREMFYPDGKEAVKLVRDAANKISLSALVPASTDPQFRFAFLGLWQYDAVIAVSPRPETNEVVHEIRINPAGR